MDDLNYWLVVTLLEKKYYTILYYTILYYTILNDRSPHQKSRLFIASKGVGLSLDNWIPRKALKCLL